jgi:uracil-DNA glycosylase family 4
MDSREKHPDWFNGPVPCLGPLTARLLIAGLAPGLQGANRTGRPFTGDYAGDLLFATFLKYGLARGTYRARPDDGLKLVNCRIANSVRCVPPQNKPTPLEVRTCRRFLVSELETLPRVKAILALGRVAHYSVCDALGLRKVAYPFAHGSVYRNVGERKFTLVSSYHCSRYNTNTGVLTTEMFESAVATAKREAGIV